MNVFDRFTQCEVMGKQVSMLYVTDDDGGLGLCFGNSDKGYFAGLLYFKKEPDNVDQLLNVVSIPSEDKGLFIIPAFFESSLTMRFIAQSADDIIGFYDELETLYYTLKEATNGRI